MFFSQTLWHFAILRDADIQKWIDILAVSCLYAFFWWAGDNLFTSQRNDENA